MHLGIFQRWCKNNGYEKKARDAGQVYYKGPFGEMSFKGKKVPDLHAYNEKQRGAYGWIVFVKNRIQKEGGGLVLQVQISDLNDFHQTFSE